METLTSAARRELKARAHPLKPVVMIGNDGLTAAVMAEIDRALKSHELIKVRAAEGGRETRDAALADICAQTGAQPIQHIGRILVIFRPLPPEKPAKARNAPSRRKTRNRFDSPKTRSAEVRSTAARPAVGRPSEARRPAIRKGLFAAGKPVKSVPGRGAYSKRTSRTS